MVFLEDAPVMHRSATEKTVALSSCEAELNAAVLCVQDILYTKNLIESIGLKVELPMKLEIDNKGAVDSINSFSIGGRTHHIDIKQCFLQELKEAKQLVFNWIPGLENSTDMFTNLDGQLFERYAEQLLRVGNLDKGGCLEEFLQYLEIFNSILCFKKFYSFELCS
jgi:hypothetical protein